jgi:hypothetical protein
MIQNVIEQNISAKAVSVASGFVSVGFLDMNDKALFLGIIGFIISVFSFLYEYTHKKNKATTGETVSELFKYIIYGTVAFPATYSYLQSYIDKEELIVAISVLASYHSVYFLDLLVDKAKVILQKWEFRK